MNFNEGYMNEGRSERDQIAFEYKRSVFGMQIKSTVEGYISLSEQEDIKGNIMEADSLSMKAEVLVEIMHYYDEGGRLDIHY